MMGRWGAMLICTLLLAGCATANKGGVESVDIAVSSTGFCTLNGRVVRFEELPRKVQDAGAGRRTVIRIAIPESTSAETIRMLSSRLASAGYSRLIFSKPKRADASIKKP